MDNDDLQFELDALRRTMEKESQWLQGSIQQVNDRMGGMYDNMVHLAALILFLLALILWRAW